jgi:hypothetical protein
MRLGVLDRIIKEKYCEINNENIFSHDVCVHMKINNVLPSS